MTRTHISSHFLLVGDSSDLGALRDIVSRLPVDAYGQIFIEVASTLQVQRWNVPASVTLTWLCRDERTGDGSPFPARGELVARAVASWIAEWMPEHRTSHEHPYIVWVGCATSPRVDRLYRDLAMRIDHARLHHGHDSSHHHEGQHHP